MQIRGDIFIIVAVALALRSALLRRHGAAILLFGLALGIGIGVKVTAVLCMLAPCLLFP